MVDGCREYRFWLFYGHCWACDWLHFRQIWCFDIKITRRLADRGCYAWRLFKCTNACYHTYGLTWGCQQWRYWHFIVQTTACQSWCCSQINNRIVNIVTCRSLYRILNRSLYITVKSLCWWNITSLCGSYWLLDIWDAHTWRTLFLGYWSLLDN